MIGIPNLGARPVNNEIKASIPPADETIAIAPAAEPEDENDVGLVCICKAAYTSPNKCHLDDRASSTEEPSASRKRR